jgi:hypothetical protein
MNKKGVEDYHSPALQMEGEKHLFLIGINDYPEGFSTLYNCVSDIDAFKNVLVNCYGFLEQNCKVLKNEEATRRNILSRFKAYRLLKAEDQLVIYFSGHGVDIGTTGYLIPADAKKDDDFDYLSSNVLLEQVEQIKCRHVFLIIDACFSGSFLKTSKNVWKSRPAIDNLSSRYCLTASHQIEVASDGHVGYHSPFAKALIESLANNQNDSIDAHDIGYAVRKKVREQTANKQNPIFGELNLTDNLRGRFALFLQNESIILGLVKVGKIDLAADRLYLRLQGGRQIPGFCVEKIALIANQIKKIKYFTAQDPVYVKHVGVLELRMKHELMTILSGLDHETTPKTSTREFEHIFEGHDRMAIQAIKDRYPDSVWLHPELIKISARLEMLKDDVEKQLRLDSWGDIEETRQLIRHLVRVAESGESDNTEACGGISEVLWQKIEELPVDEALFYFKEALIQEGNLSLEWFHWSGYLDRNLLRAIEEHYALRDENEAELRRNKIRVSLKHLFKKVLEEAIAKRIIEEVEGGKTSEEHQAQNGILLSKEQKEIIKLDLEQAQIEDALSKCKSFLEGDERKKQYFEALSTELFEQKQATIHGNLQDKWTISRMTKMRILVKVLTFIEHNTAGVEAVMPRKLDSNQLKKLYASLYADKIDLAQIKDNSTLISILKGLIANHEIEEAIKVLLTCLSSSESRELRNEVLYLKREFDFHEEDLLLSDKDSTIVALRQEGMIRKMFEILGDLEKENLFPINGED